MHAWKEPVSNSFVEKRLDRSEFIKSLISRPDRTSRKVLADEFEARLGKAVSPICNGEIPGICGSSHSGSDSSSEDG
jgi:hypothetical protein